MGSYSRIIHLSFRIHIHHMFCIGASSKYRPTDITEDELPSTCLQATGGPMLIANQCASDTSYINDTSRTASSIHLLPSCASNTSPMYDHENTSIDNYYCPTENNHDKENIINEKHHHSEKFSLQGSTTKDEKVRKDVSKKNHFWMNSLKNLCG